VIKGLSIATWLEWEGAAPRGHENCGQSSLETAEHANDAHPTLQQINLHQ
jgi:hypothetical protein